jgi:hypothetical protein
MKGKTFLLGAVALVLGLSLVGCFGGGEEADPNVTPTAVSEGPRSDTQGEAVPEDIPVIPGAYKMDVISNGTQVNFTVDGDIEYVMDYYSTELEALGWMPTRAPDSAIGSIGTMSRENAEGDVVSLNMSYNANGDFVLVQIAISREN